MKQQRPWLPPIVWLAAAFATGVALAPTVHVPPAWSLGLAALGLGGLITVYPHRARGLRLIVALLLTTLLAGHAYAAVRAQLPPDAVARLAAGPPDYRGVAVRLTGTVLTVAGSELPRRYRLQVERAGGRGAVGLIEVSEGGRQAAQATALSYGQQIEATGLLALPRPPGNPGEFDYAAFLRNQGVQAVLMAQDLRRLDGRPRGNPLVRLSLGLRTRFERVLHGAMPPDQAALLAGLLFGSRSELPPDVAEDFRVAGIYHVLAVSGSNVAFVALPVLALLTRLLGRRIALLGTIATVLWFVLMTGASPSVVRAGAMAVLVLLGEALGREAGGLPALAAAGLLLLLWNPGNLWDPGFQLSFAATAGILTLTPPLGERLRALPAWVRGPLAVTLAAQVAVLPLSLLFWQGVSLVSLVANLVAAPLVEALVSLGSVMVLLGLAVAVPARWLAWPTGLLLRALTGTTHLLAQAPLAFIRLPAPKLWEVAFYYLGVAAAVIVARTPRGEAAATLAFDANAAGTARRRRVQRCWCVALALVVVVAARVIPTLGPDRLEAAFLDVGQGDSVLVRLPGGRSMLVDGGGHGEGQETAGWDPGEKVLVPYLRRLGLRRIDYLVLTHPHADHVAGLLAVLQQFPVGEVWYSGEPSRLGAYQEFLRSAVAEGISLRPVRRGDRYRLGALDVAVLGPPRQAYTGQRSDENANSVVLRIAYGWSSLLLTGDIEAPVEQDLLRWEAGTLGTGVSVLKVGHHGSRYASSPGWLRVLHPGVAVVSVGANSFGHPADETLRRLEGFSNAVARTDWDGAVLFRTDGRWEEIRTVRSGRVWRRDAQADSRSR